MAVGWEDNAHGAITDSIWGPGFVGFQIVDANGCVVEDSVLVETPSPVSLSVEVSDYNGVNISCAGYENGVIEHDLSQFAYERLSPSRSLVDAGGVRDGKQSTARPKQRPLLGRRAATPTPIRRRLVSFQRKYRRTSRSPASS